MEESERLEDERKNLRLDAIRKDLLKCAEISRDEGLLAMQNAIPGLNSGSKFLAFAVSYIINLFMKQTDFESSFRMLENHISSLPDTEQAEGHMIASVLKLIFAGERAEIIEEAVKQTKRGCRFND